MYAVTWATAARRWRRNTWLEGAYSEQYPSVIRDESGMCTRLRQFSFPGGILVAALALDQTMARVNALKNVASAVVGLVTVGIFAVFGPVEWLAVAVVAPAALIGGYTGARLARLLPNQLLKALIVTFATAVGLVLLVRALG